VIVISPFHFYLRRRRAATLVPERDRSVRRMNRFRGSIRLPSDWEKMLLHMGRADLSCGSRFLLVSLGMPARWHVRAVYTEQRRKIEKIRVNFARAYRASVRTVE
jgi:hypothetical protein